jgi:hypothetical protein
MRRGKNKLFETPHTALRLGGTAFTMAALVFAHLALWGDGERRLRGGG